MYEFRSDLPRAVILANHVFAVVLIVAGQYTDF